MTWCDLKKYGFNSYPMIYLIDSEESNSYHDRHSCDIFEVRCWTASRNIYPASARLSFYQFLKQFAIVCATWVTVCLAHPAVLRQCKMCFTMIPFYIHIPWLINHFPYLSLLRLVPHNQISGECGWLFHPRSPWRDHKPNANAFSGY